MDREHGNLVVTTGLRREGEFGLVINVHLPNEAPRPVLNYLVTTFEHNEGICI